jgi:hypothetical protein
VWEHPLYFLMYKIITSHFFPLPFSPFFPSRPLFILLFSLLYLSHCRENAPLANSSATWHYSVRDTLYNTYIIMYINTKYKYYTVWIKKSRVLGFVQFLPSIPVRGQLCPKQIRLVLGTAGLLLFEFSERLATIVNIQFSLSL